MEKYFIERILHHKYTELESFENFAKEINVKNYSLTLFFFFEFDKSLDKPLFPEAYIVNKYVQTFDSKIKYSKSTNRYTFEFTEKNLDPTNSIKLSFYLILTDVPKIKNKLCSTLKSFLKNYFLSSSAKYEVECLLEMIHEPTDFNFTFANIIIPAFIRISKHINDYQTISKAFEKSKPQKYAENFYFHFLGRQK